MTKQKLLKKKANALNEQNETHLLSVCTDLAQVYMEEGDYNKAVEEYMQIAQIHKKQHRLLEYAVASRGIGEAYLGLSRFNDALKYQQKYLKYACQLGNKVEEQRAVATIGHIYLTKYLEASRANRPDEKDLQSCRCYLEKSLAICKKLDGDVRKIEQSDMLARSYYNLGLVEDCQKDYAKAVEMLRKSIELCKSNDIYEQLYRGYTSLASVYDKQNRDKVALEQYNLAVEIAKKLKKPKLLLSALTGKSEILLKLNDIRGARGVLHKAYRMRIDDKQMTEGIEKQLRAAAEWTNQQKKLQTCPTASPSVLKRIYEQMGDAACELKCYELAVNHYKKTLEYALECGAPDAELANYYYSIAETYTDLGRYDEAVEYYEKELALCQDSLINCLNTLSKIADTRESANAGVNDVRAIYTRMLELCRRERNTHEEGRMLNRFINYLRRQDRHTEAYQMGLKLDELNFQPSDEESAKSDDGAVGKDINLDQLSDYSEDSDADESNTTQGRPKRRPKSFRMTKNAKGETKLHTAAATGKLNVVSNLLAQGHPVNVRDNCGWLPLHEACIYGHLEVVKVLVDHGATINDRGGKLCGGVSPLHDAASNGHLHVVDYLLQKGANAIAKTDDGDTVSVYLTKWRDDLDDTPLSPEAQHLYESIVERLSKALAISCQENSRDNRRPPAQTVAHRTSPTERDDLSLLHERALMTEHDDSSLRHESALISKRELRCPSLHLDCSDMETEEPSEPDVGRIRQHKGVNEYRETMENLGSSRQLSGKTAVGRAKSPSRVRRGSMTKRAALLTVDEVCVDDWLEDDLDVRKHSKKRKTDSPHSLARHSSMKPPDLRRSFGSELYDDSDSNPAPEICDYRNTMDNLRGANTSKSPCKMNRSRSFQSACDSSDVEFMDEDSSDLQRHLTPVKMVKKRKYQYQTKLTNFGHVKRIVDADSSSSPVRSFSSTSPRPSSASLRPSSTSLRPSSTSLRPSSSTESYYQPPIIDPTVSVDVRINEKLYRVPILLSNINTNTIKWLAEEAASRYAKKEYAKPELELETKSGAILADDDPVSVLFPAGSMQAEAVEARIVKCTVPPLLERYKEACHDLGVATEEKLCQALTGLTIKLSVANYGLRTTVLEPMCRALNHQVNLLELHLNGNYLSERCHSLLGLSLNSLVNLQVLNLSCTGLKTSDLQTLTSNVVACKITELDLSENKLDDLSLKVLANWTLLLKLKALNLSCNRFTEKVCARSEHAALHMDSVTEFCISDNRLNNEALVRMLSWLDPGKLERLDVSRNAVRDDFFQQVTSMWQGRGIALRRVALSRCFLVDSDVMGLLDIAPSLESVDFSFNPGLTTITLKSLLVREQIQTLDLYGCRNIFGYFREMSKYIALPALPKTLKLMANLKEHQEECDYIMKMWKSWYGSRTVVEMSGSLFKISVFKVIQ